MSTIKFRVVASKAAGNEIFSLQRKNFFGRYVPFKVAGATPSFADAEEAVTYVNRWAGSATQTVVTEFDFKA